MIFQELIQQIKEFNTKLVDMVEQGRAIEEMSLKASQAAEQAVMQNEAVSPFIMGLTVFVLAIFVGYYVVWKVTPALHSPLMAVTNAISSVIIVGALLSCGLADFGFAKIFGFLGVILAAINIFGGFIVTQRMLSMFMKKK